MKLDLGAAIKFGWQTAKSNVLFFLGILIVVFLVELIPSMVANSLKSSSPGLSAVINLLSVIVDLVLSIGLIRISLRFVDNAKPTFPDLYQGISLGMFLKYFGAYLLTVLLVCTSSVPGVVVLVVLLVATKSYLLSLTVGSILIAIPVIYAAIRIGQFRYPVVGRNAGVLESLKFSWKITKGYVLQLLIFALATVGVSLLGFLALGIGLLWAIPTVLVASAHIYRQLEKLNNSSAVTSSPQSTAASPPPAAQPAA